MCGIAGCFSSGDSLHVVQEMNRAIAHRGPDDSGVLSIRSAAGRYAGCLGHRRLAIIDLSSAGHQPMVSASGRSVITFNGEIYNFEALKRELEAEGSTFRSHCDTEVLLVGFEKHGVKFLSKLRGMFAFALWDSVRDRGFLVRDRFGIKPLYVTEQDGDVLFSSEIRPLLATGRVPRILSKDAVNSYLATGSVAAPSTIIDGVFATPAGCVVEVVRDGNRFELGERTRFAAPYMPTGEEISRPLRSHVHRIRNALRESVRYHLVSDVPVAVFLSGGIDSSAIAGLASEVAEKPLETFTITFSEARYSEATVARETALRFGTVHHEVLVSGDDLLRALPDAFTAMDQPSLDGMNTFVVSKAVRSAGLKVALSGLGGDELFGGYPSFFRAGVVQPFWKPLSFARAAAALSARMISDPRAARIADLLSDSSPARGAYRASRTLFGAGQIAKLLTDPSALRVNGSFEIDEIDTSSMSLMQIVSLYELTGYMRNTLLRDSDVFSMAHALELRVPFVDEQVTTVAYEAAADLKSVKGRVKPLLVEAVSDLLSEDNLSRAKMGFTLPFEHWMRNELHEEVASLLSSDAVNEVGLDPSAVERIWRSFQERRSGMNWSRPWALYTLIRWAAENQVQWSSDTGALSLDAYVALH